MSRQKRRGFSVNVFLPTGDPEGLKVVEKSNWSGRGLVIPRGIFPESRSRSELDSSGVYLLFGPSETSPLPMLYVGEGDPIKPRLNSHYNDDNKAFWTHAVGFTSKDNNLNKAHIQHLESRLVSLAKEAKRCELANGNQPNPPSLSEADEATAEAFLDDMLLCLPILGYSVFESGTEVVAQHSTGTADETLFLSGKGIKAKGKEVSQGFVVFKGSTGVGDDGVVASFAKHVPYDNEARKVLLQQGVLAKEGDHVIVTEDYVFSSPSQAAAVLFGRSSNGRVDWKTDTGRTLKSLQEARVNS